MIHDKEENESVARAIGATGSGYAIRKAEECVRANIRSGVISVLEHHGAFIPSGAGSDFLTMAEIGLDSLDVIQVMMVLEKDFGVSIGRLDAPKGKEKWTINKLISDVYRAVKITSPAP